jgi:hypothetical protein
MLGSMKRELSVSLVVMTVLVMPVAAHATKLYTSPLWAD